ncbi:MAG: SDR family oxidoreductase [Lysobacterales bacterium]
MTLKFAEPHEDRPLALITGGTRGIGLEMARQYLADAWRVIVTCRNPDQATAAQSLAGEHEGALHIAPLELVSQDSIEGLGQLIGDMPLDLLVNNAGFVNHPKDEAFDTITRANFLEMVTVNAFAQLEVTRRLLPNLKASDRKIVVMMSSNAGSIGSVTPQSPRFYGYLGCRAALNGLSRLMSLDLAEQGIRVALVTPGLVDTKGILDLGPDEPAPKGFEFLAEAVRSGRVSMMRPPESVSGIRRVIENLSFENSGTFVSYDGNEVSW